MEYILINKENIDKVQICCAMSNKQSADKKEWLKKRFDEGLVFYRSVERGKCFIEYIPAENAWAPIEAEDYLFINCLWIAGSMKGHGYSNDLMNKCIVDAKTQGKAGVCILSSAGRKREFLSDPKYMVHKGFKIADESDCGITLMFLPLKDGAAAPKFKESAKHPVLNEDGVVIYYSDQCPFTGYWVARVAQIAKDNGIKLKLVYVDDIATAQNVPAPFTNYALFKDGAFITHAVQSDKKFLEIANKK